MSTFPFFRKKKDPPHPLWKIRLHGKDLSYFGEEATILLQEFDRMENEVIRLWEISKITWNEYQQMVSDLQEAKQLFVRFAYK
ncbi:MAG TPA: hypothetical protein VM884_08730 [Flavisolibacter sp.]|jgi:hypothetical protein|nr:hypothetical protein [Flavisolibacter sp.]